MIVVKANRRTRAGSYELFDRLYKPQPKPDESLLRDWEEIPDGISKNRIWTVLDCEGKTYVCPGKHWVNRLGYVITENAWSSTEFLNPGFVY